MKTVYLSIAFIVCVSTSFSQQIFPKKMPGDFKIEWRSVGAMSIGDRTIIIQKGDCVDLAEGWEEPSDNYRYNFIIGKNDFKNLSALYLALNKLKAFSLKMDGPVEESYPGEGIIYTINGKKYQVGNYAGSLVVDSDQDAYRQAVSLIIDFAKSHRK